MYLGRFFRQQKFVATTLRSRFELGSYVRRVSDRHTGVFQKRDRVVGKSEAARGSTNEEYWELCLIIEVDQCL